MTILDQKLYVDDTGDKRKIRMLTTYDVGTAKEIAREISENGGGRVGSGSGEMRVMGYIPPEMWNYHFILVQAKKARNAGDMGEYTRLVRKFFEVHPSFAVITPRKYWNGSSSKGESK